MFPDYYNYRTSNIIITIITIIMYLILAKFSKPPLFLEIGSIARMIHCFHLWLVFIVQIYNKQILVLKDFSAPLAGVISTEEESWLRLRVVGRGGQTVGDGIQTGPGGSWPEGA